MRKKMIKRLLFLGMMAVLLFAFGCGKAEEKPAAEAPFKQTAELQEETEKKTAEKPMQDTKAEKKDIYQTEPVPEGKPQPVEPQKAEVKKDAYSCTISISCATLLENRDRLDPAKVGLLPSDGWVLPPTKVTFYEGENVFHVLQRVCKQQKIHLEFTNVPLYNSAYIEGIHNLYEFDAGDLSGWMYRVNGWFPNYGCSRYSLADGDVIEWVYTCDLGKDVGGGYSSRNGAAE